MCDIGAYEVTPPVVSTGGSSAVGASGATINATVTANAVDASVHFEFGASTSYGQQTPAQHVRGVFPVAVESGLSGLSPNTTYHYRVVASSTDGTAVSADQTFTTAPAPPGASPPGASPLAAIAKLTGLGESYSIFAVAASPTPLNGQAAVRGHHKGTVFSFALDRAASVKIAIQTTTAGRRVRRACRPASPRLSRKPRCTRTVTIATLTRAGHTGLNKVAFSGRISGKALKPGRYQALFSAIDAAGASAPHSLSFTIVKR
jgi:hypothetical protein